MAAGPEGHDARPARAAGSRHGSYRFRGAGTIGGLAGGRSVHANGGGSVFTYEVEVEPKGAMRLLRPVLGSMVGSRLKQDLNTLKALMESDG